MKKLVLIFSLSIFISCGENVDKNSPSQSGDKSGLTKTDKKRELVEIKVSAIGETMAEIAFDPAIISVPKNSRVKLTLENKSSAAGMLHNFVLIELGSKREISTAGIKAGPDNSFVPDDKRVIAYTSVSKMGETVSVEFDAPPVGSYHYICTYPGHTNMVGRFNVN